MGNYRLLGKQIGSNKRAAGVSERAALIYLLATPHPDREGRMPGFPDELLASVAPMWMLSKGWTVQHMEAAMRELHYAGLWNCYEGEGQWEGQWVVEVLRFKEHQHASRLKSEPPSKLPPPPPPGTPPPWEKSGGDKSGDNSSTDSYELVRTSTLTEPNRTEENRTEGGRTAPESSNEDDLGGDPPTTEDRSVAAPLRAPRGKLGDHLQGVLDRVSQVPPHDGPDPYEELERRMGSASESVLREIAPLRICDEHRAIALEAVSAVLDAPEEAEKIVAEWMHDALLLNAGVQFARWMARPERRRTWRNAAAYLIAGARKQRAELVVSAGGRGGQGT